MTTKCLNRSHARLLELANALRTFRGRFQSTRAIAKIIKQLTLAGDSALLVATKLLVDVHAHELATNLSNKMTRGCRTHGRNGL